MHIDFTTRSAAGKPFAIGSMDAFEHDRWEDEVVVTSRRGLLRLATAAVETATRFARDGVEGDPLAWMLEAREIFDARTALTACLELDCCVRTVLLHGLSMPLDADTEVFHGLSTMDAFEDADRGADGPSSAPRDEKPDARLWTSYLVDEQEDGCLHAFDAVLASSRAEAESRLRTRHGARAMGGVDLLEGFDPTRPLTEALLSPALVDMLEQVAERPDSPLAHGLSLSIEQRFAA